MDVYANIFITFVTRFCWPGINIKRDALNLALFILKAIGAPHFNLKNPNIPAIAYRKIHCR